jgi:hypothetical protein
MKKLVFFRYRIVPMVKIINIHINLGSDYEIALCMDNGMTG